MKRKIWLMTWIIFLSISWLGVNNRKIEAGIIPVSDSSLSPGLSTEILPQEKKKRQFSESEPVLITEINLYELNNAPYQLSCLKFDHKGRLFSVDYKRGLIYRFDFSPDWKKIQSFSFERDLARGRVRSRRLRTSKYLMAIYTWLMEVRGRLKSIRQTELTRPA